MNMVIQKDLFTIVLANASDDQFEKNELNELSIIQETLKACTIFCPPSKIILLAPHEKQNKVVKNLEYLGMNLGRNNLIFEPSSYASGKSLILAAIHLNEFLKDDSKVLIMPSYYKILNKHKFENAVGNALDFFISSSVMTFGMENITTPNNHVYLMPDLDNNCGNIIKCKNFITDFPDEDILSNKFYLDSGIYLTNFNFLRKKIIDNFSHIYKVIYHAYTNANCNLDKLFINYSDYKDILLFPFFKLLLTNTKDIFITPLEAGCMAIEDLDVVYLDSCENNNNLREGAKEFLINKYYKY